MEEHVIWREKLRQLVDRFGRGGRIVVADAINKSPTYISRMLSEPTTTQHRVVTHETCYLLSKAFPDWLDDKKAFNESARAVNLAESPKVVYEVRPKTKRQRTLDSLLQSAERINDDGLERLLERAEMLSESHPLLAKQTHK